MAVDFMGYRNTSSSSSFSAKLEENAVQEAASGLESVEKLIRLLSQAQQNQHQEKYPSTAMDMDCRAVADVAVSKFKKVISLLGRTRTGHARFRRAPLTVNSGSSFQPQYQSHSQDIVVKQAPLESTKVYHATPIQQIPPSHHHHHSMVLESTMDSSNTINFSYSAATSFMSSLTGDSDSKQPMSSSAFQITNLSQVSSAGKPPLSSTSLKRKCSSENLGSGKCGAGSSGRCHCSKKRKLRQKRVVRVPAISLKMADIPPDDYSWRKYGQKPIKGSPHPRGYYKCSSVRGCPARKHVERALDDPAMLVVTYEGDHNHSLSVAETSNLILESS
ncbi:probable WRKY transcription factor 7 [Malus sylvestris]|uniref:probable WRKY transcription factor 7 n=1 Tax=Malus sylvestris TaxID=3752 RepID=UPI0021ACE50C|nr:probable WRKY transcription factor 7 [Malus sylvestris]